MITVTLQYSPVRALCTLTVNFYKITCYRTDHACVWSRGILLGMEYVYFITCIAIITTTAIIIMRLFGGTYQAICEICPQVWNDPLSVTNSLSAKFKLNIVLQLYLFSMWLHFMIYPPRFCKSFLSPYPSCKTCSWKPSIFNTLTLRSDLRPFYESCCVVSIL